MREPPASSALLASTGKLRFPFLSGTPLARGGKSDGWPLFPGLRARGLAVACLDIMEFPLQITFHGVQRSDAIERYVRKRAEKLDSIDRRVTACRVAIEMPHRHAHHGEHYRVRIDITVPRAEVVVERAPGGDHAYEDLYAAIDAAFDDAARRLRDFVQRRRGDVKHHERARHGVITKLFPYEGYGFLRTPEGDELYFHRNAVLGGGFDRLKIDARVRFVEDASESGLHASTVAVA